MALKSWGLSNLVINVTNQLISALNSQYITKTAEDHLRCFVWLDTSHCCGLSPGTSSLTPPPSELRLQSTNRGHRERNRWLIKEIQQNVYRCQALRLIDLNGLTGDFPAGLHKHESRERIPMLLEPLCCILVWANFILPALISTYSRILMFTCMNSRPGLKRILCSLVFYQCSHEIPNFNPLTALPFFFQMTCQHIMHIYMHSVKKGFQLVMHIYMHTFHYFMFSWDYCKFYVIFLWNGFSRPLGVGEGVNGVRGPNPHETRSKQRWQPNAISVDRYYWLLFTCCNHLSLFEKHVSEDDGMFTLWVEGFFRLCIYICIKQSKG